MRKNNTSYRLVFRPPRFLRKRWFVIATLILAFIVFTNISKDVIPLPRPNSIPMCTNNDEYAVDCVIKTVYGGFESFTKLSDAWEANNFQLSHKDGRIPRNLHMIHLTPIVGGQDPRPEVLRMISANIAKLPSTWSAIIWVNRQSDHPSLSALCNEQLLRCRTEQISNLPNYGIYKNKLNILVNYGFYSFASDIVRADILSSHGGLYIDTDYELMNVPDKLHDYATFYAGLERDGWGRQIGSGFIASSASHPVTRNYLTNILYYYRLGNKGQMIYDVKARISCNNAGVLIGGPMALTSSFHLLALPSDVIFGAQMIHDECVLEPNGNCHKLLHTTDGALDIAKIGTHKYEGSWVKRCEGRYMNLDSETIFDQKDEHDCIKHQRYFGMDMLIPLLEKSGKTSTCYETPKIPLISHRIWITNPHSPVGLRIEHMYMILKNMLMLDSQTAGWIHYWWTNSDDVYTPEMRKLFERNNIILARIQDLYSEDDKGMESLNLMMKMSYSLACDAVKWVVLEKYGGVYLDLDYEILSPSKLVEYHNCWNLYMAYSSTNRWLLNGIIGASRGHKLASMAKSGYEATIHRKDFLHCNKNDQIMIHNVYGHIMSFISAIASESVNIDGVLLIPDDMIVNKDDYSCITMKYGDHTLARSGWDMRFNSWSSSAKTIDFSTILSYSKRHVNLLTPRAIIDVRTVSTTIPKIIHIVSEDFKYVISLLTMNERKFRGWKVIYHVLPSRKSDLLSMLPKGHLLDYSVNTLRKDDFDTISVANRYGGVAFGESGVKYLSNVNVRRLEKLVAQVSFFAISDESTVRVSSDLIVASHRDNEFTSRLVDRDNINALYNQYSNEYSLLIPLCAVTDIQCPVDGPIFVGLDVCENTGDKIISII